MGLTHVDQKGHARMVDVGAKAVTQRVARAGGKISMGRETLELISNGQMPKGDVLAVARVAGIMAAKKTSELIPLCHPVPVSSVKVELQIVDDGVQIEATASTSAQTGVEMEALTAVSVAALTIYDMVKAKERRAEISDIFLLEKSGGKSGHFVRETPC